MPNAPKTPNRVIRVDDELWARFGAAAANLGLDRSTYLREFMRWAVRDVGARMPKRPESHAPRSE